MSGFWRLSHEDLSRVLARADLSWETARVYLALADLTLGYGNAKDVVSLGQIAEFSGVNRRHLTRALQQLEAMGLYGQREINPRKVERWVVWPATPIEGNKAASTDVGTSTQAGTSTSTNASTGTGTRTSTDVGTPQERRIPRRKKASVTTPPKTEPTKPSNAVFKPPTLEEVLEFSREKGGTKALAIKFFNHYTVNDWRVGRVKMKVWQPKLENWQADEDEKHPEAAERRRIKRINTDAAVARMETDDL